MPDHPAAFFAPGAPGAELLWSRATKDGVGTAYHTGRRVWFTLARGVITEVYCPTVDTPNTRDLQFLITDGETFTPDLAPDAAVEWTSLWQEAGHWEGENFRAEIV